MKRKLTKAEYDALSPEMKLLYIAEGDSFILPLTDYEDAGAAIRARDREKAEAATAKAALATANAELERLRVEPARKTGDIAVLEKSWADKLTASETASAATIAKLKGTLESTLIDHAATQFAAGLVAKPENASLMLPHVRSRFEVVYDGDVPTVKIKDATGRISAMNTDELKKEMIGNPLFASIVVVNKGSGAGGSGSGGNGGSGGAGGGKKFADMTGKERTDLYNTDRAAFDAAAAEQKAAKNVQRFGTPKLFKTA